MFLFLCKFILEIFFESIKGCLQSTVTRFPSLALFGRVLLTEWPDNVRTITKESHLDSRVFFF